jgi:hypothetical protein
MRKAKGRSKRVGKIFLVPRLKFDRVKRPMATTTEAPPRVQAAPCAPLLLPGEQSHYKHQNQLAHGVPMPKPLRDSLDTVALE